MAGVRHHILPRFILKGFASRIAGEEVFTWVYRKNGTPFETNTRNVAVEKHFYGKEGEISADDAITELEGKYTNLIDELRQHVPNTQISNPTVGEFISHLAIRTKHLRDSFRESTEYLLDRMEEYLADFNNLKKLFLNHPQMMKEEFFKVAQGYPLTDEQKEQLWQVIEPILPAYLDQERAELQSMRDGYISVARSILPIAFRDGHIKSLAKRLVPKLRADDYASLIWSVVEPDRSLILGDVGCLFEIEGDVRFKSLDDKDDKIKRIYLPISSDRILIGNSGSISKQVDFEEINSAIVRCSRDFFVCNAFSKDKEAMIPSLGKDSSYLTDAEMEQLINEFSGHIENGTLYKDSN